jgi:Flp pilus assembly protein TadG
MRRRWSFNLFSAREGSAALEFALVALPFLMLTFGTIEFGRLIWIREALQMTANQGARCMGVLSSSCASSGAYSSANTTSYIRGVASGWGVTLTASNLTLTNNAASGSPCSGLSQVTINYTFLTAVPALLTMLSGGTAVTARACFPNQS